MKIRIGYELVYDCPQPTPMILTLSVHYTRVSDIIIPDHLIADPPVPLSAYRDSFGNWCSRIVAPKGLVRLSADALLKDTGQPDVVVSSARQTPVEELPDETLLFLLGSRYCETDRLSATAWQLFGRQATGQIPESFPRCNRRFDSRVRGGIASHPAEFGQRAKDKSPACLR